jgi:hypothetical protein
VAGRYRYAGVTSGDRLTQSYLFLGRLRTMTPQILDPVEQERYRLAQQGRCYYDPRDLGFVPVGNWTCPVCGEKSYWNAPTGDSSEL